MGPCSLERMEFAASRALATPTYVQPWGTIVIQQPELSQESDDSWRKNQKRRKTERFAIRKIVENLDSASIATDLSGFAPAERPHLPAACLSTYCILRATKRAAGPHRSAVVPSCAAAEPLKPA